MATAAQADESDGPSQAPRFGAGFSQFPFVIALSDIKLAHSVFALPFAILAAFLSTPLFSAGTDTTTAANRIGPAALSPGAAFAVQLVLVVVCMVAARTWAMLINRLADRAFDAANPRTSRRPLASGRVGVGSVAVMAGAAAGLFVAATAPFLILFGNRWPLILSLPVLAWIAFYSFTKRFTALCHVFLGGALAASPVAAAIAVNPAAIGSTPAIWWLSGMVLLWVAGFDVIYALQDIDFDRSVGLRSIPARAGWRAGLWVSRALHLSAFAMLLLAAWSEPRFGPLVGLGALTVGALLTAEHLILVRRGRAGLDMAFFTLNGVVSCVLGVCGCIDVVL